MCANNLKNYPANNNYSLIRIFIFQFYIKTMNIMTIFLIF